MPSCLLTLGYVLIFPIPKLWSFLSPALGVPAFNIPSQTLDAAGEALGLGHGVSPGRFGCRTITGAAVLLGLPLAEQTGPGLEILWAQAQKKPFTSKRSPRAGMAPYAVPFGDKALGWPSRVWDPVGRRDLRSEGCLWQGASPWEVSAKSYQLWHSRRQEDESIPKRDSG